MKIYLIDLSQPTYAGANYGINVAGVDSGSEAGMTNIPTIEL
jgi:hypothetical protein